jgi:hypothetical protein
MNILDSYVTLPPDPQHAIDLFQNEWSSAMPHQSGLKSLPGAAGLFEDPRIVWADDRLGFAGRTVLELGPLEGGHSYMMHKLGAKAITAIEANSRAFLKCLIVKELFKLDRVSFQLGDFNAYLLNSPPQVDICVASGVLYHCVDPVRTLNAISRIADRVFLWTHYFDEHIIHSNPILRPFFDHSEEIVISGQAFTIATKRYEKALEWQGFCGGTAEHARWLSRDALIHILKAAGITTIDIAFDDPAHPNGPAIAISGKR